MNLKTTAKIAALGAVIALSGCAFVPDNIGNHYHPPKNLSAVPGAQDVTVHVNVKNDKKHGNEVGRNTDDLGIGMSGINLDISKDLKTAINEALNKRGFHTAPNGEVIQVEVQHLWFGFHSGWAHIHTHGHGSMLVSIPAAHYQHEFQVKHYKNVMFQDVFFGKVAHRTKSANAIMTDLVNKMVENPGFIAALFRAAGQAQPAPGVSVPMIPAQG